MKKKILLLLLLFIVLSYSLLAQESELMSKQVSLDKDSIVTDTISRMSTSFPVKNTQEKKNHSSEESLPLKRKASNQEPKLLMLEKKED